MKTSVRIGTVLLAALALAGAPVEARAQVEIDVDRLVERITRASERILERAARAAERLTRSFTDDEGYTVQEMDYAWSGRIDRGATLEIKGVNGEIVAVPATGREVEVTAVKRSREHDPDEVDVQVVEHAGGITVCAVYPTPRGKRPNECAPGDGGRMSVEDFDVQVDFRVAVPPGVEFRGATVNGDVRVGELDATAEVESVNGDVEVVTRGFAQASTVNGSIRASLGSRRAIDGAEFETVNGSIELDLPDDIDADIDASWVNGGLESDLPLTLRGRMSRHEARGSLGGGGPLLRLATVNGSIHIR